MSPTLWFILLCGVAFLMFALEVFIPDLILATIGAVCLVAACVVSFQVFEPGTASWVSLLLILGTLGGFIVWLIKMPDSKAGKMISLNTDLHDSKASKDDESLVGKQGTAETALKPGGFARIEGLRMDVVLNRGFVDAGCPVEVVEVHGSRVVVKSLSGECA